MEVGFFLVTGAFGLEILLLAVTVFFGVQTAKSGNREKISTLWWLLGISIVAATIAVLFSLRYIGGAGDDLAWHLFLGLAVLLPLLMAAVVIGLWRSCSKQALRKA